MATTTIPWGDGSGDNIYLTYPSASGDQTVQVSSDANTGSARTKTVTFTSGVGSISKTLTVNQEAGGPQEYTITKYPSSYDTEHYSYYGLLNVANAYDAGDGDYATITLTRGNGAETYIYFQFDLSSIPDDATIDSISLTAKAKVTTTAGTRLGTRVLQVCRGTTAVGTATANMTTGEKTYTMDVGTGWTGANIKDLTLKVDVFRGTQSTSTNYYCYFYGATLTIKYIA
jgi:hypothetical protein